MKNAPEWTPEFLERCAAFEKFMGWREGVVIDDLMDAIRNASRSELEEGMRNDYLYLGYHGNVESIDLGSYRADLYAVTVRKDDMTNWDEFISTRLAMLLLGGCDED